jgi:Uma2 family endonuclease
VLQSEYSEYEVAAVTIQEKTISASEFWELCQTPEYEDLHVELIEGEIEEMAPAGGEHGVITVKMTVRVGGFVEANDLGYVTAAETGYVLHRRTVGKDTVLAPDMGFVAKQRATEGLPKQFVPFAPDLAVEVISPSESYTKVARKVALYLRYGTRLVWVIDPSNKTVQVHALEDGVQAAKTLGEDSTLTGGDVLPGFTLSVRELFS